MEYIDASGRYGRPEPFPMATHCLVATALVWSKAPVIVGAHDTGPLIRSKDGF